MQTLLQINWKIEWRKQWNGDNWIELNDENSLRLNWIGILPAAKEGLRETRVFACNKKYNKHSQSDKFKGECIFVFGWYRLIKLGSAFSTVGLQIMIF